MNSSPVESTRPTSVRWVVLALLFAVSFAAYVQRLNFNVAGKFMIEDLGLSKAQLGWSISAFIACYTLFQLPGGMAGERFGSRRTLTWIVVLWGAFTLLTGLLPGLILGGATLSLISLLLVRALMGVFQAPVFPVLAGSIASWFPVARWALPNALSSSGLTLGAMATSPVVAWLAVTYGWRASLVLTAPFTLVIAALWWWYARDEPAEHASVNAAELRMIQAGRAPAQEESGKHPWLKVLANREVLLLTASYFCSNYAFYFFFSWFFIYLVEDRGFTALEGGFAASVPWLTGALGAAIGGAICDWACKRFGPRWGCRGPCVAALVLVAITLLIGAAVKNAYVALVFLSLAFALQQFTEGTYWAGTTFVAGRHTATASGILNTGGNLVGILSTQMFVLLEDRFGAMVAVASGAVFALLGAALWLLIRVDHPLQIEEKP
ncbi:MAG: MFS transporter [Myxococcales bacterium]|nr:MFS transporter [Myxococcales bacterium]